MIRRIVAGAKEIIAFFMHLQIVKNRETRNVRKKNKRKKDDLILK